MITENPTNLAPDFYMLKNNNVFGMDGHLISPNKRFPSMEAIIYAIETSQTIKEEKHDETVNLLFFFALLHNGNGVSDNCNRLRSGIFRTRG